MFGGSNSLLTPSTFFALEQSLLFNGRVLRVVSASHSSDLIKMRICAVYNWVWAIGKSWMRRQASFHLGKKCRGIWRQVLFHFSRLPCLGSGKSSVVKRHWHFFYALLPALQLTWPKRPRTEHHKLLTEEMHILWVLRRSLILLL